MNLTKKFIFGLALLLLNTGNLFAQSINKQKLLELVAYSDSLYADEVLVIYKGEEILYWKDPTCSFEQMNTASLVKSLVGLAFGILVDQGNLPSIELPVCDFLSEWKSGCDHGVTIRQLLHMMAGFNTAQGQNNVMRFDDMNAHVLQMELNCAPGEKWAYSNESVQLLGIILERISGMPANDFMTTFLFEPLDMKTTRLTQDQAGNDIVYGGCMTSLRELSHVALMVRNKGVYNGKRMVSENWINQILTPSQEASNYSLLWWHGKTGDGHRWVAAAGGEGNWLKYFPDLDLIYLRHQHCEPATRWPFTHGGKMIKKISEIVEN